jgi:hypothetical protein
MKIDMRRRLKLQEWQPDWLDESAYGFLSDASWDTWAWQFLRRNGEYQTDWDHFISDCNSRCVGIRLTPLSRKLGGGWCLSEMVDPSANSVGGRWLMSRFAKRVTRAHTRANSEYLDLKIREKQAYGLDLTKPITPQIKAVEADLRELQKHLKDEGLITLKKPGKKVGDFKLYLRILDARAARIPKKEIIAKLDPYKSLEAYGSRSAPERLDENLKAARRLANVEYQMLLLRVPDE